MTYRIKSEYQNHLPAAQRHYRYTADGPGLLWQRCEFDTEQQAQVFIRNLEQAFEAGKQARSRELLELLGGAAEPRR